MMRDISFIDKLKVLVDVSSSSGICIASIFVLIFLGIILLSVNKKNSKKIKMFMSIIYIILVATMLILYWDSLATMFDYMMNNFFILFYFPNLAIYLAAIIASNIILIKTVFSVKTDKLLKIVNVIFYSLLTYLMVLILNIVSSNKLNVFDQSSVYGNNNALALIGLSSLVFIIWIIFIIIYSIIRSTQVRKVPQVEYAKHTLPANIVETVIPKLVKEVYKYKMPSNILETVKPTRVKYKYTLPANIVETVKPLVIRKENKYNLPSNIAETIKPMVVRTDIKHYLPRNTGVIRAPRKIKDYGITQIIAPKLVKNINIEKDKSLYNKYDELLEQYDNMLSLDDYKTVLDILKNKDKYEKQENTVPSINYTYNVNNNIVEEDNYVVQPKLDELLNLSKSV